MKTIPHNSMKGLIMVKVCTLLITVLFASQASAALVYLDDAFTVAPGSEELPIAVRYLSANDAGDIYYTGGSGPLLKYNGLGNPPDSFSPGENLSSVRRYGQSNYITASVGAGASGNIYSFNGSSFSTLATMPNSLTQVLKLDVDQSDGDILLYAEQNSGFGDSIILKYNAAGTLQWQVPSAQDSDAGTLAYDPTGQGYFFSSTGTIWSINDSTGALTDTGVDMPSNYVGTGLGYPYAAAFHSEGQVYLSMRQSNTNAIGRLDIDTGDFDLLVRWDDEIPPPDRDLSFAADGLYVPVFNPGDLVQPDSLSNDGLLAALSYGSNASTGLGAFDLIQGDFSGEFAGFSSNFAGIPEPSSMLLLAGLLIISRKKNVLRTRPLSTKPGWWS